MDRKKKLDSYVEPMPKKLLRQLICEFERIGGKVLMEDEIDAYLDSKNAEACTLNGYTILLKKKPGRAAVYEELFHAEQLCLKHRKNLLTNPHYLCIIHQCANVTKAFANEIT